MNVEDIMLNEAAYMRPQRVRFIGTESRMVVARGNGACWSVGTDFLFWKMRNSDLVKHKDVNNLKATKQW